MTDTAIRVEGLSKRYVIGAANESYDMLREKLVSIATAPARALRRRGQSGTEEYWALRDVSFEVKQGEVLGIIGRNGAGKSTLLKILSRITEPTAGRAVLHGRVGSLLEVGTGFHPELTGRENIYLNGAILGMSRRDIDRRFDEIVEFADIGPFLDTPVKRYSSGMYMRLAFSVAAHLEPEILIVDEVLAVGDAEFQKKSLGKMGDVAREGRTVLFVSHNMAAISRLCPTTLWLESGRVRIVDETTSVISRYLTAGASLEGEFIWHNSMSDAVPDFRFRYIRIRNQRGDISAAQDVREPFVVEVGYELRIPLRFCRVGISLSTMDGTVVFESYDVDNEQFEGPRRPGVFVTRCYIPGELLRPGRYTISVNAGIPNVRNLMHHENVLIFDVEDVGAASSHMRVARRGVVGPKLQWEVEEASA